CLPGRYELAFWRFCGPPHPQTPPLLRQPAKNCHGEPATARCLPPRPSPWHATARRLALQVEGIPLVAVEIPEITTMEGIATGSRRACVGSTQRQCLGMQGRDLFGRVRC